ncbi:MAG: hypothetical protein EPO68_00080 [Planctomycetota bacterium]|nr:MAG: hypothetical protein EPO68_00080 [Planctomycetota bacterium]
MRRFAFAASLCALGALASCGDAREVAVAPPRASAVPANAPPANPAPASAPAPVAQQASTQPVLDCFAAYRQSLLDQDGPRAASLVSDGTVALYQSLRDVALVGSEADVRALRLVDRLQVLLLRVRVPAAQLGTMDGRALFAHTVTQNWIGKAGIQRASLGAIELAPPRAVAVVLAAGAPTGERYHFEERGGAWRFDLLPSVEFVDQVLRTQRDKLAVSEDQLLLSAIETLTGNKPDASIWKPLR